MNLKNFGRTLTMATLLATFGASAADYSVRLLTLDPGHFHAGLVQKLMYPQVDPVVHVYAPAGAELEDHLKRVESFNTRPENPTHWQTKTHVGSDFLNQMVQEKAGNVVVISG
ncbi:MAG: oxidoreductase, partial [Verrucomicrobia bacterium]|nr:oxidoreductase [Verrucomicrobiota bacterium]